MSLKKCMKFFISTLVIGTMVLGLSSCGEKKSEEKKSAFEEKTDNTEGKTAKDNPYSNLKIGMVNIGKSTDTSGYTYAHVSGVKKMAANLGISESNIVYKNEIPDNMDVSADAAVSAAIQECIDAGCKIIFTTSYGYKAATSSMATKYPDIYFAHGSGDLSNGKNFIHYFGRIYQARYLSGIAAGLKTKTNKIGYVSAWGTENSECTGGINAFAMGVASVNPNAKVYVRTTDSWYDEKLEKEAAQWLISHGADVIAQHCDTPQPQIAAQEAGVYGIGYNSDMSKEAPKATLLSVVWDWSAFYTWAVQSVVENKWDGTNYFGGIKEGMVSITDLASFNDPNAAAKIKEATDKMTSGSWDVFQDVIPTNTGATVGTAGQPLDDDTIQFKINWYYKNVKAVN